MELHTTATIGQIIGRNIRDRRAGKWSQSEFGRELGTVLPKPWPAQTVSGAEKGDRAFAAAELVAIAHLLDVPVTTLFTPPVTVRNVEVTDALTLRASAIHRRPGNDGEDVAAEVESAREHVRQIADARHDVEQASALMKMQVDALFAQLDLITRADPEVDIEGERRDA